MNTCIHTNMVLDKKSSICLRKPENLNTNRQQDHISPNVVDSTSIKTVVYRTSNFQKPVVR